MPSKQRYAELHQEDSAEISNQSTTKSSNICAPFIYLIWITYHILLRIFQFFCVNKTGILGLLCTVITIIIISFNIYTNSLSLSESRIYDYIFIPCIVNKQKTMCPSYQLNHTMYFQYDGVYISPYVQKGVSQNSVFFHYDFCLQTAIPKYPSNYERHCNLMSAGIGTKVSLLSGYTLSILALFHCIIILMGYCQWNAYHKLNWILVLVSSFCYIITCIIWQFLGHIDIISNKKLYSEAHSGMKVQTNYGYSIILILLSAFISIIGAFCLKFYIWNMKIEDFRYKYDESETSSKIMSSADLNFINGTTDDETQSLH